MPLLPRRNVPAAQGPLSGGGFRQSTCGTLVDDAYPVSPGNVTSMVYVSAAGSSLESPFQQGLWWGSIRGRTYVLSLARPSTGHG